METFLNKLTRLASKVKTPLLLAGLVTIIFYAIFRQVLSLDIFDNIGANNTFAVIQNVLDRIFFLALVAIVLGVASYLITFSLDKIKPSNVSHTGSSDSYPTSDRSEEVSIRIDGKVTNTGEARIRDIRKKGDSKIQIGKDLEGRASIDRTPENDE